MPRFLSCAPAGEGPVLLGVPLDLTTSFRPGTRFAPERVRCISQALESYSPHWRRDLEELEAVDGGDVLLPAGVEAALAAVEAAAGTLYRQGKRVLFVGGEHLISYATIAAARAVYPELAVLCWDAHADGRPEYLGLRYSHATVSRRIAEAIGEANLWQAGIRSVAPEERSWAQRSQGEDLVEAALAFRAWVQERPVYLSIDIDVVDPAYAPGTGAPEPGGPTSRQLLQAVYALEGLRLVGADIVEVCPPHDSGEITALLAAKLARELLFLLA